MNWVAIDVGIASDPTTLKLADDLDISVPEAGGLLAFTFCGMMRHADDGDLSHISDVAVETWANWHGDRGRYAAWFRTNLCDDAGIVRAWEKYNGASVREAKASAERSKRRRKQLRQRQIDAEDATLNADNERGSERGSERDASPAANGSTRPNLTEPTKATPTARRASRASRKRQAEPDRFDAFWAAYPHRAGGNPRKRAARTFAARVAEGVSTDDLIDGARRYAAHCERDGKVGTPYVMQAATFLGPDERWREEYADEVGHIGGSAGANNRRAAGHSPEHERAARLYEVYARTGLCHAGNRDEQESIATKLTAEGLYPSVEAAFAEWQITRPTLLANLDNDRARVAAIRDQLMATGGRAA